MKDNFFNSQRDQNNNTKKRSKTVTFVVSAVFYVLSCIYLPLALFANMGIWFSAVSALGICVFAAFALSGISGSFKPFVGYALIVALFTFSGGMFLPMSLLVAFASGCVVYAYLLISKLSAAVWGLPVAAAVMAGLLTQSPIGICLSLGSLPASAILALVIKNKTPRVSAVCRISAGICLSVVVSLCVGIYAVQGKVNAEVIKGIVDYSKQQMSLILTDMFSQMQSMLGDMLVSIDFESFITVLVSTVFNLLPAIIITAANIIAYIIHSLYISSQYTMSKEAHDSAKEMLTFDMSIISAVLYILSLVLAFTLISPELALWGTVAENLLLILVPGLVLTALACIRAMSVAKGPSCLGTLIYFGVIFLVIGLNPVALVCVALAGAVFIILSHISKFKHEHRKE